MLRSSRTAAALVTRCLAGAVVSRGVRGYASDSGGIHRYAQTSPRMASGVRLCALCGTERKRGSMEEMGSGSGFYRCMKGHETADCAPERRPPHLRKEDLINVKTSFDDLNSSKGTPLDDYLLKNPKQYYSEVATDMEGVQATVANEQSFGSRAVEELQNKRKRKSNKEVAWREKK
ncbi:hypothetical protein DIPPA_09878 [Diplonema papillatum]|nr:hypothetical protein DIPPA_09878 [Diplonema papillatum]